MGIQCFCVYYPQLRNSFKDCNEGHFVSSCHFFASFPCPSCSVVYSTVKYGSPYHWLHKLWQALMWRRVLFRIKETASQIIFSSFLSPFFVLFFLLIPQHWAVLVWALWKYYFVNCKHNKIAGHDKWLKSVFPIKSM